MMAVLNMCVALGGLPWEWRVTFREKYAPTFYGFKLYAGPLYVRLGLDIEP